MRKTILALTLIWPAAGCVSVASNSAVCDGTRAARSAHATALADDGGPQSVVTGARLIGLIDAGCND